MTEAKVEKKPAAAPYLAAGKREPAAASASAMAVMGWDAMPAILARIKAPQFPAKDFLITNYGAKSDGTTDPSGGVSVLRNHQDGTFESPLTCTGHISPVAVAMADFNGDGLPDWSRPTCIATTRA